MYQILIVNVDELWLKGKNRPVYFKAIRSHVKAVIQAYHQEDFDLQTESQRLILRTRAVFSDQLINALLKVPGLHSVIPAKAVEVSFDAIMPAIMEELKSRNTIPATFKVYTKRANKSFPINSMDVSKRIGHLILESFPQLRVDVVCPELRVEIRILDTNIFISTRKLLGIGGLPFGTNGHLITLLSGGFDSPVASYLMSKRGCRQTFVFFHAYPYVGDEVKKKLLQLTSVLATFQKHCCLYVVPFGDIQEKIAQHCQAEYRTVLFRKYMIETAKLIMDKLKADAVLTGDSLGQVSSQTIYNIAALDSLSECSIFRPLLGMNKSEIIELSKEIGTHDISVIPHDDACSLFAPKHPIITPNTSYLKKITERLQLQSDLLAVIERAEIYSFSLRGQILA